MATNKALTTDVTPPNIHLTPSERSELGQSGSCFSTTTAHGDWEAASPPTRSGCPPRESGRLQSPGPRPHPLRPDAGLALHLLSGGGTDHGVRLVDDPQLGPVVQACGDAHLSNFGVFASAERNLVFDLNDFDETLPGPWEWDVKRLAASLVIAGRDRGFSEKRGPTSSRSRSGYRPEMTSSPGNWISTSGTPAWTSSVC